MSTKILPDVNHRGRRELAVTDPNFSPDNVIVAADYTSPEGEMLHYPVEVKRKDLLAALGAEPDESDYAEVLAENSSLGLKLAEAVKDRDAAERAEPDESDYAEVVEENNRLSRKLSAALRDRDANRAERDAARFRVQELLSERDSWKDRAEAAGKDRDAAERERDSALEALRDAEDAAEEPRVDPDQIDRSWALERAGEVVGRLAAAGVHLSDSVLVLKWAAEWILAGKPVDRV